MSVPGPYGVIIMTGRLIADIFPFIVDGCRVEYEGVITPPDSPLLREQGG